MVRELSHFQYTFRKGRIYLSEREEYIYSLRGNSLTLKTGKKTLAIGEDLADIGISIAVYFLHAEHRPLCT